MAEDNKSNRNNQDRGPSQRQNNSQRNRGPEDSNWTRYSRVVLTWLAVILLAVVAMNFWYGDRKEPPTITYMQYRKLLDGKVKTLDDTEVKIVRATVFKANLNDYTFVGELNQTIPLQTRKGETVDDKRFTVVLGALDGEMEKEWVDKGIDVSFEEKDSLWTQTLIGLLPWVLIIGVWLFFMRRMQAGAGAGPKGLF